MKNVNKIILAGAAVVVVAAALLGISAYRAFYRSAVTADKELYVYRNASYADVEADILSDIRYRAAFRFYARHIDLPTTFKAGHYILREGMSVMDVARMLKLGLQTPVRVIVNNARIPAELAGRVARQIEADSASLFHAFASDSSARSAGFDSLTFFSMFIPNTYEFYWTVTPEDFVKRMRREYDAFWTPARESALARCRMSRVEVMTLASIVYEETKAVDEMARVAGVYVNRLHKGMPLQADPTVKYALQDFGLRRILHEHLRVQSPYNTYINKGLPPSPICMPSIDAIDAVLHYEEHPYIYFCARPEFDGHHNFARTYSEHLANARAYVQALKSRDAQKQ